MAVSVNDLSAVLNATPEWCVFCDLDDELGSALGRVCSASGPISIDYVHVLVMLSKAEELGE